MKIVALDIFTANYGGCSWKSFDDLGEFVTYPRTTPQEILARSRGATAVIVNKVILGREHFTELPDLQYIGVTATGTNNIDLDAARDFGIVVTNVRSYSVSSVAQLVFGYILDHSTKLLSYSQAVRNGEWSKSPDFCFYTEPTFELAHKKLGIVGYGEIGQRVGEIGKAFGMEVLPAKLPGRSYSEPRFPLEEVAEVADVLTFHCPLTPLTERIINNTLLQRMKASAILINTARGGLVDEPALAEAMKQQKIAHAYLDVLAEEPPKNTNPLLALKNITITPHVAWSSHEARQRLITGAAENLAAYLRGEELNRVA